MRQTMSISLPKDLLDEVEKGVKEGGFSTKSEYIRQLVRDRKQEKFMQIIKKNRQDFKAGKGKILKSLKDLK